MGWPRSASWTRIWWRRPVPSARASRVASSPRARTRKWVMARRAGAVRRRPGPLSGPGVPWTRRSGSSPGRPSGVPGLVDGAEGGREDGAGGWAELDSRPWTHRLPPITSQAAVDADAPRGEPAADRPPRRVRELGAQALEEGARGGGVFGAHRAD